MANAAQDQSNIVNEDKKLPKTAFQKLANHSTAVIGAISAAVIAGANQLVDNVSFKCPCLSENATDTSETSGRPLYGNLFVFGPALILLCVGISLNRIFWEKLACCCKVFCVQCKCCGDKRKRCCASNNCTLSCLSMVWGAVAFWIWVLISLVDGDFIACAYTVCASRDPMADECQCKTLKASDGYAEIFRLSQKIGWFLAVGVALVVLIVYVCYRGMGCIEHPDDVERRERDQDNLAKAFADSINTEGQPNEGLKAYVKELNNNSHRRQVFWNVLLEKLSAETSAASRQEKPIPLTLIQAGGLQGGQTISQRHKRHQEQLAKAFADSIRTEGQPDEGLKAYVKELKNYNDLRQKFWNVLLEKLSGVSQPSNTNQVEEGQSARNPRDRPTEVNVV